MYPPTSRKSWILKGIITTPPFQSAKSTKIKKECFLEIPPSKIFTKHTPTFASPLAYDRHIQKNFNVRTVNYNPEITERSLFVSTHSLEQFSPVVVEELGKGTIRCERSTLVSTFKNSLGPAVNVGAQAYSAGKDFKRDIK